MSITICITEKDFKRLVEYVKQNFGINLTFKKTLVESRLTSTLSERGMKTYSEYIDIIMNDTSGTEASEMLNKLTTNLTYFMRETDHFKYFFDAVLPWLENTVKDRDLRIWSAGCSSGEEAYTLAMLISDYFKDVKNVWDTHILATDISEKALDKALLGVYTFQALEKLPLSWKLNYFTKLDKNTYKVNDKIKEQVVFGKFNLAEEIFPFKKKFHVIFCRNVMIYFDNNTKENLIKKFHKFTGNDGYLFIGHSESINKMEIKYKYVMPSVYRKV